MSKTGSYIGGHSLLHNIEKQEDFHYEPENNRFRVMSCWDWCEFAKGNALKEWRAKKKREKIKSSLGFRATVRSRQSGPGEGETPF